MNREESLKEFKEKVVKTLEEESISVFEKKFKDDEEKVKEIIINGMKSLISKANEIREEEKKIAVFQFELLRINILNESYKILIHGYSSSWYLDTKSIYEEIDLRFLFETFITFKEKLIKEKRIIWVKLMTMTFKK